ncbi:hypothetical protein ETC04_13590 [Geobacillus sp. MR]|uniref:S-layer homology domain-containing protein n=1 Tax=Geobacillus sp. MR TaxID=2508875 RepID=UPI00148C55A9|nr:S-layer homology domain-containing protein [Geobacillus sp. MR]NNU88142.1 hypothetical protein [Geobacillus sp. MR]
MAYQPKSYRKFAATTATAAMVASAVAPVASLAAGFTDVAPQYKDAVDFLVSTGATNGKTETQFGVYEQITRLDAAVILAKVLKLDVDNAKDAGFTDVPKDRAKYVNALVEAGILNGKSEGKFGAYDNLTRVEMAKIIANAYKLEKQNDNALPFTDVNATWAPFVKALYDNGVTSGKTETSFGAYENITRGDFARFVYRAANLNVDVDPEVVSVSAINPTTLKLEGEGLKNLKADQISVEGNTVTAVTPAADGKSATVTLGTALTVGKEYTVTVTVDGEAKTFTVKFDYTVTSVSLDEKTYDDDTVGQKLTFKVNGETVTADTEWLRQAGYTVNFVAVDNSTGAAVVAPTKFFKGANPATSSTGLLDDEVTPGEYTVEVQIIKDGKVVVSDKATITIADLESTATAINSVKFTNYGKDYTDDNGTNDDFEMNSTTLVIGESAEITEIIGNAAGKTNVDLPVASAKVTSSNPAVISVNGQTITANAAGTATITVKVGNATKTINFTVTNATRKVAKVTPSESTVKVVVGATRQINVTAEDQYGDPIAVPNDNTVVVEDIPQDASSNPLVAVGTGGDNQLQTGADGKHSGFEVKGLNKGNGTVLFKDTNGKVLGQIAVTVTDKDNFTSSKLELVYDTESTDNTLVKGKASDDTVKYQVSKFNSEGAYNGAMPLALAQDSDNDGVVDSGFFPAASGSYYVISSKPSVATVSVSGSELTVTAQAKGTADIVIYDENGLVKHKFTVTVTEEPVTVTKVNFKAVATIDYAGKSVDINDFLDVRTDTGKDPIVYGIEHNADTIAKVRLDSSANVNDENGHSVSASATNPVLYIDADNSGHREAGEVVLGVVSATLLSGSQFTNIVDPIDLIAGSGTTASGDKGTILFRVIDDANADGTYAVTETIATTTLNINVK